MYRFLEGLVPKTSKVSPQTPKVFERGSEYPQIDFKWLQKCSKWPQPLQKDHTSCRFLAIFTFLGFVGIFWGTPAIYFADFGAILAIFDHFWTILGPIFFYTFFGRKSQKPPKNKVCGCVEVLGKILTPPPRGGVPHMTKNPHTAACQP